MSIFLSENKTFQPVSCVWNHCAKLLLAAALLLPLSCVTDAEPSGPDSQNQGALQGATATTGAGPTAAPPPSPANQATPAEPATLDPAPPPAQASAPTTPAVADGPPALFAEPISRATVARFPHLSPYEGHVLLSAPKLQAVLAGVPPEPVSEEWQPAVVALIERRGETWRSLGAAGRIEISAKTPGGGSYRSSGVNVGIDRAKNLALATYVFTGTSPDAPRQAVSFRLDAATGRLAILPDVFAAASSTRAALWRLRFRSVGAQNLIPPEVMLGTLHGVPYLFRYRAAEIVAVVGFRPFDAEEQLGQLTLTPESGGPGPAAEGWQILVGREAASQALAAAANVKACMYKKNTANCEADIPASAILKLSLAAGDAGGQEVAQPVFVYDHTGRSIFYTALFAGDVLKAPLPKADGYRLADTRSGRVLRDIPQLSLAAGGERAIDLPARIAGGVRLDPGEDHAPAIVTINRLDQPKGLPVTTQAAALQPRAVRLSDNSFLVREWPVELPLLSGAYVVELARGGDGVFCNARVRVVEAETRGHQCPARTYDTAIPNAAAYLAADLAAVLPPRSPAVSKLYQQALGVQVLIPAEGAGTARAFGPPAESPTTEGLAALEIVDEGTGLTLRYFPSTPDLETRWLEQKKKAGGGALAAFAKLARSRDLEAGILELGCPVTGVTLTEYEQIARRLQVDAVRLFGCAPGIEQSELLAAAGRMQRKRKQPLVVTSVSALAHAGTGLYFPRILFPTKAGLDGSNPQALASELRAGRSVLSAGAARRVVELRPKPPQRGDWELVVEVANSPEVRPRHLFIYTETGQIKKELIPDPTAEGGALRTVTVNFSAPQDAQWFRVEARGSSRRSSTSQLFDKNYGVVLATTGFAPLKAGVAH